MVNTEEDSGTGPVFMKRLGAGELIQGQFPPSVSLPYPF
uniref:Uncharacterized protein n=1 Tax=Anguilla anguilla TaxID=7936 RepID=A0A0E9SC02_ANGAN